MLTASQDGTITFNPLKDNDEETSTLSDDMDDLFYVKSAEHFHACLLVNTHVYVLADKLKIPGLKQLAVDKFERRLEEQGRWPYYKFTEVVAAILRMKILRGYPSFVLDLWRSTATGRATAI